jgi:flagellar protein FliS
MDNRLKAYQHTGTLGKSQIDLVLQVYDGAIAAFTAAGECYKKSELTEGYEQLQRARKFLTHLYTTLDFDKGREVAENLGKLYAFLISQTDLAVATKDQAVILGNVKVLRKLREGWSGIRSQEASMQPERSKVAVAGSHIFTSG